MFEFLCWYYSLDIVGFIEIIGFYVDVGILEWEDKLYNFYILLDNEFYFIYWGFN